MSQSFYGAQPKVVKNKAKYNTGDSETFSAMGPEAEDPNLNIMHDKRVFRGNTYDLNLLKSNLTPMQKEELRIKAERERKKMEMIKSQLVEFKKAKNKISPYDLRPGPPARIEVDLTYFLTEQNKPKRPEETEVKCQTDDFVPRPPTPPYLPKKTGIDKITQIEDYDLFDYDTEVQPILNVLLSKTVEQALLEVEEETELDQIRQFKDEAYKRLQDERDGWEQEVKREVARIKAKNKALKLARLRREQQLKTMDKIQCMAIAKGFLANNFLGSMQSLATGHHWRSRFDDQLNGNYKEWLFKKVADEFTKGHKVEEFMGTSVLGEQMANVEKVKEPIKKQIAASIARKEKVLQIESKQMRTVHFIFDHGQKTKVTPFTRKYLRLLDGSLKQFEENEKESFDNYIQSIEQESIEGGNEEWNVLRHNPIIFESSPFFSFELTGLSRIAFQVADDPFYK